MALFHFVVPFIVLLGVLVLVHEFGHYLVARCLGIRVLRFSVGFGPRLLTWTPRETEYALSAIPLGGYVKLFGEDPSEELSAEERVVSFSARPVWQRFAVVFAGPAMNFVLAAVTFGTLAAVGTPVLQPVIGAVRPDMPAGRAGLVPGDRVTAVSGRPVETWEELSEAIGSSRGAELVLTVRRAGRELAVRVAAEIRPGTDPLGEPVERPVIGIGPSGAVEIHRVPLRRAAGVGVAQTARWTAFTATALARVVLGRASPRANLGGPIAIAKVAGETARLGFVSFALLVAVLSVNLGLINLLPIPVLDGGHLLFFLIEGVRRRPVSVRYREAAQQLGLVLLLSFMVYVVFNDIARVMAG